MSYHFLPRHGGIVLHSVTNLKYLFLIVIYMTLVASFSGVRGIFDESLTEDVALKYGFSFLSVMKKKHGKKLKLVIGNDTRLSHAILKKALITTFDCEIIDIGVASTPMVEFCVRHFKANGGVVITASHNEPMWNGFKFLDSDGAVLSVDDMNQVIAVYESLKGLSKDDLFKNHVYTESDPKDFLEKNVSEQFEESNAAYIDYVLSFLSEKEKEQIATAHLSVLLDPNGGTGTIAKPVLEILGVKVHSINTEHAVFNRLIEPNEDSLVYLTNDVRDKGYAFAAGFDCDADRVEVVTAHGLLSGNHLLALIADDVLSHTESKCIVVNNATSLMVRDIATKHGAAYHEVEVGETNVVSKMYELDAAIGGEGSSSGVIIPPSR